MNTSTQRYIFTDFDNIQRVRFRKLERVCDKIFILINSSDDMIPFSLVKNLQKLGKAVKWIPVENNKNLTLNYHICYLIGKMHVKINSKIEFAILSDDDSFDPMINYINSNNRKCRRVKTDYPKKVVTKKVVASPISNPSNIGESSGTDNEPELVPFNDPQVVAYRDTKDRLKLIKSRPYNVSSLRDYIHINNQELVERRKINVEEIIELMEINEEIEIRGGLVAYHF